MESKIWVCHYHDPYYEETHIIITDNIEQKEELAGIKKDLLGGDSFNLYKIYEVKKENYNKILEGA